MRASAAGLLFVLLAAGASSAGAQERWYLMARHGECFELDAMQRRIPELADAKEPYAFVERMKQKGFRRDRLRRRDVV